SSSISCSIPLKKFARRALRFCLSNRMSFPLFTSRTEATSLKPERSSESALPASYRKIQKSGARTWEFSSAPRVCLCPDNALIKPKHELFHGKGVLTLGLDEIIDGDQDTDGDEAIG